MNRLEKSYSEHLGLLQFGNVIHCWRYEKLKLKLAKKTWLTPDFLVIAGDGALEFHEVKGHWEDDARVKIKVAAETYPEFRFLAVTRAAKNSCSDWEYEEIEP
jgi:hypothetical protein